MNVVCIIQARMNSTRLPKKVMLPLVGKLTALDIITTRVMAAKTVNQVVVATSLNKADVEIEYWCLKNKIACYRGSEADVLGRVYEATKARQADVIVDITADCPLVDPQHIDRLVNELLGTHLAFRPMSRDNTEADYVANCWQREWPDGLDIQVYTMLALHQIAHDSDSIREHVGWNIPNAALRYDLQLKQVCAPAKYRLPHWGLTLDEPQDYELLKRIFMEMYLKYQSLLFPVEAVLDYLLATPALLSINADVRRKVPGND